MRIFSVLLVFLCVACASSPSGMVIQGRDGKDGRDGFGCSVKTVQNGALVTCQDGTSSLILNGVDGLTSMYSIVKLIDACGKQGTNSAPDEVFLLLDNGDLIASFSANANGNNTRFSSLIPSPSSTLNGVTTDGTSCGVSVSRDNQNNILLTTSNGVGGFAWKLKP